ncbi:hypothetical protein MP638_003308 [Amoeboaphelidium occidentale]|nr:hypothetical protein MP638_003308 [Amoeboaphelidium occidentale]
MIPMTPENQNSEYGQSYDSAKLKAAVQAEDNSIFRSVSTFFSGLFDGVLKEWQRVRQDFSNAKIRNKNLRTAEKKVNKMRELQWSAGAKKLKKQNLEELLKDSLSRVKSGRVEKFKKLKTSSNATPNAYKSEFDLARAEAFGVEESDVKTCLESSIRPKSAELSAQKKALKRASVYGMKPLFSFQHEIKTKKLKTVPVPRSPGGSILAKDRWPTEAKKELLGETPTHVKKDDDARREITEKIREHVAYSSFLEDGGSQGWSSDLELRTTLNDKFELQEDTNDIDSLNVQIKEPDSSVPMDTCNLFQLHPSEKFMIKEENNETENTHENQF